MPLEPFALLGSPLGVLVLVVGLLFLGWRAAAARDLLPGEQPGRRRTPER